MSQTHTSRMPRPLLLGALAVALLAALPQPVRAAGLLIADGGFGGTLEIVEHDVKVTINNGVAVTEVNQAFRNTEQRVVEALYVFPVPKSASVANFSMVINGKEMIGEVVEKQRAREIYDSYKQKRRDPGLLEQTDYKTFEMRIFPIAPGAVQQVKVTYYQELDFDHDWATYVYPLATQAGGRTANATTQGKFALNLNVLSQVPIVAMESPSHGQDFVIAGHADDYWQASLETDGGDLSRDLVIAYQVSRPKTGIDLIASRPKGEDGYFMLTLTAGDELTGESEGMDYVFILDVSGSMQHDGKLAAGTQSLSAFINALSDRDRFEVMTFNVQPYALFNQLSAVTPELQERAASFLSSQQARGGTMLRPALEAAYRYADADRPLNVVILSDGMTEQNERSELLQLIRSKPEGARVFAVGVGNEINRPLLSKLAHDAGGLAAFISRGDDFNRQAAAFRRKLTKPVAANVAIQFEGADVYDVQPGEPVNLYHGAPVRLYGRYRKAGPVQVKLSAEVQGRPISQAVTIELPQRDDLNPQIERMWAWHKVQRLLGDADAAGSRSPSAINEVVRLGEAYSIATEYTSFIVLENDSEYQRWKINRRNVLRLERDREARDAVQQQLDRLRSRAAAKVGPTDSGDSPLASAIDNQQLRQLASAKPTAPASDTPPSSSRGWDLDLPIPTGGGGAIDPLTATVIVALGCGAGIVRLRRRRTRRASDACHHA